MTDTYATKGLPPPPDVSMTTKPMAGLLVDIYGLSELPPAPAPVTCLWLLHPRTRTRARMHDIARRTVRAWNQHQQEQENHGRGLVALAFDMPNHGSRLVSDTANMAWDKGNEQHAIDMAGLIKGAAGDMSALMDLVAGYLGREVDAHVCLGWSLGGHAAWQGWFGEERIDAAVVVVGCPDYMGLMSSRGKTSNLDCGEANFLGSKYFPPDLIATCLSRDPKALLFGTHATASLPLSASEQHRLRGILDGRVRDKKLLLCSGGDDALVPYQNSLPFLEVLKDAVDGWYGDGGVRVADRVYEGIGHRFSADMVKDAVEFLVEVVAEGPRQKKDLESKARM